MTDKERYAKLKAEGICVHCKVAKAENGKTTCSKCAEIQKNNAKERREWLLSKGFCMVCGREKVYLNETKCYNCREKALKSSNSCKKDKEYAREYARKWRADKKAQGYCTRCGKRKVQKGKSYCSVCNDKRNEGNIPRTERFFYGLCYYCGAPLDTDKRLCSKCCGKIAKNLEGHNGWKDKRFVFGKGVCV